MIISFKHKGLRDFFEANSKRGIPTELSTRLRDRLDVIDTASTLEDIALPHFDLHQLKGDRAARGPSRSTRTGELHLFLPMEMPAS